MRIALLTTSALLTLPAAAFAQAAPATAAAPQAADDSATVGLADIIVTAQRKVESAQKAAVAISVVQGADLIKAGVTQIDRLTQLAPALTVTPGSTGAVIFVRGIGNFTVSPNSDPAIAFNYDGVYVGRPSSTTGIFFDLDRVEVLKGPQGTLYGRNATGGAINVLPTQPKLGELSGYASASYGNYNAITAEGAINVPMGEHGAFRVSASIANHDGYLKDGTSDDKTHSLRFQMKSELTPDLTVRIAGDYSHTGGLGYGVSYLGNYVLNPATSQYSFVPSNLSTSEGLYTPAAQAYRQTVTAGAAGRKLDNLSPLPFQDNDFYGANADIIWKTGIGTLTITPAYRDSKLNYLSSAAAFMYREREQDEQYSFEARLTGQIGHLLDYTLGSYYYNERITSRTALSLSSAASFLNQTITTKSFAPFGRLTAHVTDKFRLVGGLRYTKDNKSFVGTTVAPAVVCVVRVAGVPTCPNAVLIPLVDDPSQIPFALPASGGAPIPQFSNGIPTGAIVARADRADNSHLTNHRVTYRAAAEYDIFDKSLLYASFETGYRSGGFSAAQGFETYQPEYLNAYTIGMKNRFLDNKLQINIEGFLWQYKNQQINHVGVDLAGRTANYTQNVGRSKIKGAEVETRFLVTPTTLVSADVQYLDTKNQFFTFQAARTAATPPGVTPPLGLAPPATGCALTPDANPAFIDVNCAGLPAYNSPKWTINLAGQQTFPIGDYKVIAGVDTQYKSKRYGGFAYLSTQLLSAYWDSNAQISFGPADDRWSISAYIRNLENNREVLQPSLHPTTNILVSGTSAPRTYGVRASAKF